MPSETVRDVHDRAVDHGGPMSPDEPTMDGASREPERHVGPDPFDDPRDHLEGPKRWYATTVAAIHAARSDEVAEPSPKDPCVHETHTSHVVLVGDRAYKIRKPERFAFLDLARREDRERIAHREVELNRRLAPDVYLGVLDVTTADGEPSDHIVEMRRLPGERRLSALLASGGDVLPCLTGVARRMASFHAAADRSSTIDAAGSSAAIRARWESDLQELRDVGAGILERDAIDRVQILASRYIDGRGALFASRIGGGRIVDGHGDLLAADVYCLADGPRILDCLEFDDALRYGDVVADVAFLAMDLEHLGHGELAGAFLDSYRRFSGDVHPPSLANFYIAQRAVVRSKVACIRHRQGDPSGRRTARSLLELAERHLRSAIPRMVLIGGLPGTGKTTVATAVSDDAELLRSDEIRKDLAGRGHTVSSGAGYRRGIYDTHMDRLTYDEMIARARSLMAAGHSVVLDASWLRASDRERARDAAEAAGAEPIEIRLVASPTLAAWRIERRAVAGSDCSDATPDIAVRMAAEADAWPEAITIGSTSAIRAVAAVREAIRDSVRATTGAPVGTPSDGTVELVARGRSSVSATASR